MNPLVLYAGHETGAGGGRLGDGGWPQTDTALSVVGTAAAGWLLGRRRTAWRVHFKSNSESFDLLNYVRLWKTAGLFRGAPLGKKTLDLSKKNFLLKMLEMIYKTDVHIWVLLSNPPFHQKYRI